MISLLLTILCSTSIALILKYNEALRGNKFLLFASNYFVATVIITINYFVEEKVLIPLNLILLGGISGFLFVIAIFFFSKAIEFSGAALATVSSRLSVVVPFILSIVIFSEEPAFHQYIGFFLALTTIVLFYISVKNNRNENLSGKRYSYLILVLLGIGSADFCMKIFQANFNEELKEAFLLFVFGTAFIYTMVYLIYRKIAFERKIVIIGAILGFPNVLSSFFLIDALEMLPAVYVYPIINIGVIILTGIIVWLIWKEKLDLIGIIAVIVGILSVVLLTIK